MTNNTGWIKLHRQILENELYFTDRFSRMHVATVNTFKNAHDIINVGGKSMKKPHKLLRKFLAAYRDEITRKPFSKERSRIVDACTFIVEVLNGQKRNS